MHQNPVFLWRLIAFIVAILLAGNAYSVQTLPELLQLRLSLMKDVAAFKWQHNLPVEDLNQEAVILKGVRNQALQHGFEPKSLEKFFSTQMSAAKEIQRYWIDIWQTGETPKGPAKNLKTEIRPQLISVTQSIVTEAHTAQQFARDTYRQSLNVEGLSPEKREDIINALFQLAHYESRLDQILDTGILRIGTTGDYPPFTYKDKTTGKFSGTDIDNALDLANSLGVKPVFVATSWPNLMSDLQAGLFDIGMGGISLTLERLQLGYFSQPYYKGGKTIISRCENAERFASLDAVDKPDVRVIVNPGGTNQRFVNEHIHNATVIVHQNNLTIFDALMLDEADVMITDKIEAEWQSKKQPALCTTMKSTLTHQEKAYLLPRDTPFKIYVDTWLSQHSQ